MCSILYKPAASGPGVERDQTSKVQTFRRRKDGEGPAIITEREWLTFVRGEGGGLGIMYPRLNGKVGIMKFGIGGPMPDKIKESYAFYLELEKMGVDMVIHRRGYHPHDKENTHGWYCKGTNETVGLVQNGSHINRAPGKVDSRTLAEDDWDLRDYRQTGKTSQQGWGVAVLMNGDGSVDLTGQVIGGWTDGCYVSCGGFNRGK